MLSRIPAPTAPVTPPSAQPPETPPRPDRPVELPLEPTLRLVEPEPAQTEPEPEPDAAQTEPEPEPGPAQTEPEPDAAPIEPKTQTEPAQTEPEPEPDAAPIEPKTQPEPAQTEPEPKPGPEPATAADARLLDAMARVGVGDPLADDLAGEEPEDSPPFADETPAASVDPEDSAAGEHRIFASESEPLVFWLFGQNKVSPERESMLALLVANNRRLHLKDGARILELQPTTLRMRLTRAAQDGWTKHSGINHWSLSDQVTTDLEMLITAVSDGDEHMAAQIAEMVGPPLPALRAEWIDNRAGGLTPREELRAAADSVLASAAELWPANRAFVDAADRLYEDA